MISAIIPTYNDIKNLNLIVAVLKDISKINEIIIVDDGSNKKSKRVLGKIEGVKLITNARNMGKSKAVKVGIENSLNYSVLLIDADLTNLKPAHIRKMIDSFNKDGYDMVLGDRQNEFFLTKVIGFSTAYGGERLIKDKNVLLNNNLIGPSGYLLEPNINRYYFKKTKVKIVKLCGLGQEFKIQKKGAKGFIKDLKMYFDYIKYLGLKEFLFQLSFCRKFRNN